MQLIVCQLPLVEKKTESAKTVGRCENHFQEIWKHFDWMLTVAAEKFVDFIGEGNVGKLDAFPDIWCSEKENMLYILSSSWW